MVELEPLDDADRTLVCDLLGRHRAETGSVVAEALLADWAADPATAGRFTKVMPRDYRRVLLAISAAEESGESCLLYTSDAADEEDSVDLGGRRIIKKKKKYKRRKA